MLEHKYSDYSWEICYVGFLLADSSILWKSSGSLSSILWRRLDFSSLLLQLTLPAVADTQKIPQLCIRITTKTIFFFSKTGLTTQSVMHAYSNATLCKKKKSPTLKEHTLGGCDDFLPPLHPS